MRAPEETRWHILVPFDVREGVALKTAADRAGKSETTVRGWCVRHGLGRRVGDGVWVVSRVALTMFLEGDLAALDAYRKGDRSSPAVGRYFERMGLPLPRPAKAAVASNSAASAG
jgi:hypothetical protein